MSESAGSLGAVECVPVEVSSLRSHDLERCLEGLGAGGHALVLVISISCLCLCVTRLNDCHGVSVFVCWRISGQRPISPVLDSTSLLPASSHAHSPGAILQGESPVVQPREGA